MSKNTKTPSTNDNPDSFESIAQSQIELYKKKNSDYGSATDKLFQKHGFVYYQIMLEQKMQRIDSLIKKDNQHNFESLEDTLLERMAFLRKVTEEMNQWKSLYLMRIKVNGQTVVRKKDTKVPKEKIEKFWQRNSNHAKWEDFASKRKVQAK